MNQASSGLWRDGRELVLRGDGARFPKLCLKSAAPIGPQLTAVDFVYDEAGVDRWKISLRLPLSASWRRKSRSKWAVIILIVSVILLPACGYLGTCVNELFLWGLFFALMGCVVGPFLVFAQSRRIVRVTKWTESCVWLRGAHRDFLACLPEWPGDEEAELSFAEDTEAGRFAPKGKAGDTHVQIVKQSDAKSFEKSRYAWPGYALASAGFILLTVISAAQLSQLESGRAESVYVWEVVGTMYEIFGFAGALAVPATLALVFFVMTILSLMRKA